MEEDNSTASDEPSKTFSVSNEEWNDWRWQLKNSIKTIDGLRSFLTLTPQEEQAFRMKETQRGLPVSITPYFASLIDKENPNCPIRKQVVPSTHEFLLTPHDMTDPCGEDSDSPVPGLVHRYPDRVLLLATNRCSVYCRYCTRNRWVGSADESIKWETIEGAVEYLRKTKRVRDVLISGGDPLLLSDEKLERILSLIRAIPHIEIIRIGSRAPVCLPQRVTTNLVSVLKKFHPFYLSLHFSHPKEITPEVAEACIKLADGGIPLGDQTVLLRGINDKPEVLKKLFHELVKIRVRPYYLYQCDPVKGTSHFRTTISKGIEIIEKLRGHTTGYAIPTYVVDCPGGGGKIPISPQYVISKEPGKVVMRNYEGKLFAYHEPKRPRPSIVHSAVAEQVLLPLHDTAIEEKERTQKVK